MEDTFTEGNNKKKFENAGLSDFSEVCFAIRYNAKGYMYACELRTWLHMPPPINNISGAECVCGDEKGSLSEITLYRALILQMSTNETWSNLTIC